MPYPAQAERLGKYDKKETEMESKITLCTFQTINWQDFTGENLDMATNGKSRERVTEFLQIAPRNNTTRTNYIKTKIYYTQQISTCWLCRERDDMVNYVESETSTKEVQDLARLIG